MPEFQSPLEFTPRLWNDTTQNLLELIFQVVIEAQLAFNKKDPEQKSLPELETVVMQMAPTDFIQHLWLRGQNLSIGLIFFKLARIWAKRVHSISRLIQHKQQKYAWNVGKTQKFRNFNFLKMSVEKLKKNIAGQVLKYTPKNWTKT